MAASVASRITTNAALLIDAAGCFAGAAMLTLVPSVWDWVNLPDHWRQPVVVALFLFSVLLVIAARYANRPLVVAAVAGNIAWIIAGGIALFETGSVTGGIIIAAVMVADAVMAWLQFRGINESKGTS